MISRRARNFSAVLVMGQPLHRLKGKRQVTGAVLHMCQLAPQEVVFIYQLLERMRRNQRRYSLEAERRKMRL